ncbi:MAG: alpha/beta hydrolase [Micromonosporaceae bacterium]|nr:alpha/beta hydrolase [Micromonosporaceae bacterium]
MSARTVLVIPGRMFGPYSPLLFYAAWAARVRGAQVRNLHWTPPSDLDAAGRAEWVRGQVGPVLDEVTETGGPPLVIAKSLGSYAAPLAAERGLPAVWLTPLLREPEVVAALRRATAPYLLIGGTADPEAWDGQLARQLSPHVLEVDGADHGMFVPGPLAGSAAVLGQVATAVERFLDQVVWPV